MTYKPLSKFKLLRLTAAAALAIGLMSPVPAEAEARKPMSKVRLHDIKRTSESLRTSGKEVRKAPLESRGGRKLAYGVEKTKRALDIKPLAKPAVRPPGRAIVEKDIKHTDAFSGRRMEVRATDRKHILENHRAGAGKAGKTEFPKHWSDAKIIRETKRIANNKDIPVTRESDGRFVKKDKLGSLDIQVVIRPKANLVTSYTTNTPKNPRK